MYRSSRVYGFQARGVALGYLRRENLVIWSTGLGKAMPLTEPVLTPAGWRPIGDLTVGDQVFTVTGQPVDVLGVYPQGVRPIYRVTFSDGSWARCDEEHLWTVSFWSRQRGVGLRVGQTVTTRELLNRGVKTPQGRRRFSIPITAPVQYPAASLPLDPYTLGVLLGDGYIRHDGRVWMTTDKEILDTLGLRAEVVDSPGIARTSTGIYAEVLCLLGLNGCLSQDKFVPEVYLRAGEDDRRALLAGLLDTDGSPMYRGGVEFTSTSPRLIDAVCELTESLGGQAKRGGGRFTTYTHNGERRVGQESWRVNVKLPSQPFRLARKMVRWVEPTKYPVARWIESIEPDGHEEAVCIRVDHPSSLYLTRHHIVTHNTHFAMAQAALLAEDGLIDHVLVVCESNKIKEVPQQADGDEGGGGQHGPDDWVGDFRVYTNFQRVERYMGAARQQLLADLPQVLVTTYETSRNDGAVKIKGRPRALQPGPLANALAGKKVLVIYDEASRLKNRDSGIYRHHDTMLKHARRHGDVRTTALTATPLESSPENIFNIARLLQPGIMTVNQFEFLHVRGRDIFGRATGYHHIGGSDRVWPDEPTLFERLDGLLQIKDKFDADVLAEFPKQVEEFEYVEFPKAVAQIMAALTAKDEQTGGAGWMTARQFADHPAALLHSQSDLAQWAVREYGSEALRALPVPKLDTLLRHLELLVGEERRKVVVFTFFGQSVLPLLHEALTEKGYRVAINHGRLSPDEREAQKAEFRSGSAEVYLTSDAGSRGINLPEATVVINYEMPLLHATYEQRINRIHRIDSDASSVLAVTLIAKDTVEEDIVATALERNAWFDAFVSSALASGTSVHRPSAAERQLMLRLAASQIEDSEA